MKRMILAMTVASAVLFSACDKDDEVDERLSQQDRDFLNRAAQGNLAEVTLGQLAQQRGTSDSIITYGAMMVADHTRANAELDSIARTVNFDLPTTMDAEHEALRQRLSTLSGVAFDTAYINSQVLDHQRTITLFETQANQGSYQPLKDYANRKLPALRMHFDLAQEISDQLE